jgi:hypothetical protein
MYLNLAVSRLHGVSVALAPLFSILAPAQYTTCSVYQPAMTFCWAAPQGWPACKGVLDAKFTAQSALHSAAW